MHSYYPAMSKSDLTSVPPGPAAENSRRLAAVDLGSNSFHMVVVRQTDAGLYVEDRVREPVRLASGLQADKSLDEKTQQRALECLGRFGQILRGIPAQHIRVVGTNTLRRMQQSSAFLRAAEKALGCPVEVISGVEEARLIYEGVAHDLVGVDEKRLVVDIGGGSTELIVGTGMRPKQMESVHMGCVSFTQRYFADGKISPRQLMRARRAAAAEIEFLEARYRNFGWQRAIGASGSVRSVWRVAQELGFGADHISLDAIDAIHGKLSKLSELRDIKFSGLREDRRAVFAGSFSVLAGIFDALYIERMEISDRALREGVIYDLIGRNSDHDIREKTVQRMMSRFGIDTEQATRVERVARRLFDCVADKWGLSAETEWPPLRWAAALHELGLVISHSGFHKHGAYMLAKADMHGFSRRDQLIVAALVRVHRGRMANETFADLPSPWSELGMNVALILRLAVLLCRSRQALPQLDDIQLEVSKKRIILHLPPNWLEQHPLTEADVDVETGRFADAGWKLKLVDQGVS